MKGNLIFETLVGIDPDFIGSITQRYFERTPYGVSISLYSY